MAALSKCMGPKMVVSAETAASIEGSVESNAGSISAKVNRLGRGRRGRFSPRASNLRGENPDLLALEGRQMQDRRLWR